MTIGAYVTIKIKKLNYSIPSYLLTVQVKIKYYYIHNDDKSK